YFNYVPVSPISSNCSLWIGWRREAWWRVVENEMLGIFCPNIAALPCVSPYNTLSGPPPSITIVVSCVSDDERGRYRGPGLAAGWEKGRIRKPPLAHVIYVKYGRKSCLHDIPSTATAIS